MNKISSGRDYEYAPEFVSQMDRNFIPIVLGKIEKEGVKSVLEIGCGNGTLARAMASTCPVVVGMDPSESGIEIARKNCPAGNFYCLGVYDDPETIAEREFDLVICAEVVEHLFYPRELPRFVQKKLKKGGTFIVTAPYHGYLKNLAIALFDKWDSHHTLFWDGGHIKFWSRATLTQLLEEEGFKVTGFHGCGRGPYLWESMVLIAHKL